jgi:DNA-binding NtrC family response regulator
MVDEYKIRFLVVDDQQSIRRLCVTIAASLGFECSEAENAETALEKLENDAPDIVLLDLRMAQMSGLEFLAEFKKILPHSEVSIMTGYGSIETAVQAMKLGAYDYITKPFRVEELKMTLQRMAEKVHLVAENEFLRARFLADTEAHGIIGNHPRIQDVLRIAARLKDTRTPVLITGESGTGKELVARAIHFRGAFANRPFVTVDCGALVPTLVESELFGHERGAFTGAHKAKEGLFQSAKGGTILLDEVSELPLETQATLLRVLQEKEVRPVGSNQSIKVNVRILAASNRDLQAAYMEGAFRKDLFFRLNVVAIQLPSLRERKSDVPILAQHFLHQYSPAARMTISNAAMESLMAYDWPGNVRELQNCIERAVALGGREIIDVGDLPANLQALAAKSGNSRTLPAPATDLEELERVTIQRVFDQVQGDKALAGKMLGISRATLYRKLKRYGIKAGVAQRAISAKSGV